jgi:F420-dependent oxidoreductase-like protein
VSTRIGLKLAQDTDAAELRDVWRIADDAGFDHLWCFDHFASLGGDPTLDLFEAWTQLAAMAIATRRVRIGCMVAGNTYRHPAVAAKMAVTVDHFSDGRLEFGLGAAWAENEHTMLGLDFGTSVGERIRRLDEACHVVRQLWQQERASFAGRHYALIDAIANPKPVQKPYPPIWIGGRGERKTLRVVAEHADVWNSPGGDGSEFTRLCGVLDRHCETVGRDPAQIRRSIQVRYDGDHEQLVRETRTFADLGASDVIVLVTGRRGRPQAEAVAALLPRLRGEV